MKAVVGGNSLESHTHSQQLIWLGEITWASWSAPKFRCCFNQLAMCFPTHTSVYSNYAFRNNIKSYFVCNSLTSYVDQQLLLQKKITYNHYEVSKNCTFSASLKYCTHFTLMLEASLFLGLDVCKACTFFSHSLLSFPKTLYGVWYRFQTAGVN